MESPPSFSTHSEAPPLSEDSGLLITSGSFSSDSASGWHHIASELVESDDEERSLSLSGESTEASERMGGDLFNTVRKSGRLAAPPPPIDPPPQFQDSPVLSSTTVVVPVPIFASTNQPDVDAARNIRQVSPLYPRKLKPESLYERRQCLNHRFASPRLLHLSPCRATRPSSRSSLSSRLSSSHNSLVTQFQADDSNFITQAISHDALSAGAGITDVYNVPLDSDIYSVPVDTLGGPASAAPAAPAEPHRAARRRARSGTHAARLDRPHRPKERHKDTKTKRHSLPSSSSKRSATDSDTDSLHLTLREMRKYLHTLYSSSSDSECRSTVNRRGGAVLADVHLKHNCRQDSAKIAAPPVGTALFLKESIEVTRTVEANDNVGHKKPSRNCTRVKIKKHKETGPRDCGVTEDNRSEKSAKKAAGQKVHMSAMRILSMSLKQSFCNLFRWRRSREDASAERAGRESPPAAVRRALPPLPPAPRDAHDPHGAADPHGAHAAHARRSANEEDPVTDFATSIQKVKDYGWYWGPLSVEAAERVLSAEPDGSFIVRDSSDDHYIFTLTFKLNGLRHVRIEHDQGNFCFGGCTMFKAQTIVEFIENAVETSRSGRYLFFLNLRPALGPVRVQLLHPVSRFKRVQSLQHMCRFVVLKRVRRDLVGRLPLPRRLLDYLGAAHYYSELLADI